MKNTKEMKLIDGHFSPEQVLLEPMMYGGFQLMSTCGAGVIQRHVEVDPHQNALAAEVCGAEAGQGTLRHGFGMGRGKRPELSPRPRAPCRFSPAQAVAEGLVARLDRS